MKWIERVFPWLLITPVILPVVIWGGLIYPYLVPKTLLFYALELISLAAFALLVAYGTSFYWGRLVRPESWIPLALLVLAYVASFFGVGFYHSFWSIFVRGDGLLMLSSAVASFYLILLSADKKFLERLLQAVAFVGTVVAVYGIGEWLMSGGRIGSLLGNAAFFAGYLGIAFFATLAAAQTLPISWQRAAMVGAVLQGIAIVLTATRGTLLALVVAGLVTLTYFALKGEGASRTWSAATLAALVVFGGLFFAFRTEIAKVPFEPIARVAKISVTDPDVASRLFIWKHMIGQIEQRPLLGVGAEHIDVLFNNFYDPSQIQEQWFDRSHNAFLDYAAQYGIGGLLLYLGLIGSFFVAARRLYARGEKRQAALFALLAVTYAVQNFFVFDTVSSFWLFLALLAVALAASGGEVTYEPLPLAAWVRYAAWPFGGILLLLIIPVSIRPALAAHDLVQAYAFQVADPALSARFLSRGMALGTYGDLEYGYEAYDMYVGAQLSALKGENLVNAYQSAKNILTNDFNQYPYDARTALYLAHVLTSVPPGVAIDESLLSATLTRTIQESPKRYQAWYILTNLAISRANAYPAGSKNRADGYAAARDIVNKYVALVPALSQPHYVLAELLLASGDVSGAATQAVEGKRYYRGDLATAERAAGYYEGEQDWTNAAFFLSEVARLDPGNYTMLYDLAKVQFLLGDKAAAEQVVQTLRAKDPTIIGTDQNFLQAITTYERSLN